MGRQLCKLTNLGVQRFKEEGRYADGGGLYLQVSNTGTKAWLFRFSLNKKSREMGLGSLNLVSLAEARDLAMTCRKLLHQGIDPISDREEKRRRRLLETATNLTFDDCASAFISSKSAEWSNVKHKGQWANTLKTYASPVVGSVAVRKVDTAMVMRVLQPIWGSKTETATRVRGRMEAILDWATVSGFREGENPARWRGHLDKLLPAAAKIKPEQHHPALPVPELPAFMDQLKKQKGRGASALELLILTALRTNELLGGKWNEIDFEEGTWIVPATRMKAKVQHRVPLSPRALTVLGTLKSTSENEFIFPGMKAGRQMSNTSMLKIIKLMKLKKKVTGHGFRSTFRDWVAEYTNFPSEVAEMALAHKVQNKVEAAYRRGDLFLKRRKLMDDWAKFCSAEAIPGKVLGIRSHIA